MTIRNSHQLMIISGCLASATRRAAGEVGRSSLIFASLVLAAAIMLPSAAFAAPLGAVGQSPILIPVGGKDPPITFSFDIGGNSGTGTLTATNEGGGLFLATGGTLTMSSTSSGDAGKTYCLVPAVAPPGSVSTSPLGAFLYDDVVQPGTNPAFPDIYGLLFSNNYGACTTGGGPADEINIWAGTSAQFNNIPGQYSFYDYSQASGSYPIAYTTPSGVSDSFSATVVATTYSYTGNAFNLFFCGAGIPDCSTPVTGNPYGPKNSVTAALQLAGPLCSTPGSCPTAPINVFCGPNSSPATPVPNPNFVSLTLNDGQNTLSASICGPGATAWVATDVNGNINAWYLDATGGQGSLDIHTLYDPSGAIAAACSGCYGNDNRNGEDKGTSSPNYGYVLNSPGTFLPLGQGGGTTTAGNCTAASPCQISAIASTVVTASAGATVPQQAPITENIYFIAADPRGPNCGYNGPRGLPVPLVLSKVLPAAMDDASQARLGSEIIPWNVCIPPGGAWVDYAVDEQLATINGINAYPSFIEPQGSAAPPGSSVLPCPNPTVNGPPNSGYPFQLVVGGTRKASLTEEQHPEGTLIPAIASCDGGKGSSSPARSVTLFNVQFIQPNPSARFPIPGTATNQQILVSEIVTEYAYLDAILLPLINFQPSSDRKLLDSCYKQALVLIARQNYSGAAAQTYQCDQILQGLPVTAVGPSSWPLRLPDPWGDLHARHLTLYFLLNTGAAGNLPNQMP